MEYIQKKLVGTLSTKRNAVIDLIKWFAIITMVIDHSYILLPQYEFIMRGLGRWAFPFFCLILAYNSHNAISKSKVKTLNNYLKNLIIFSLISEIPYQLYDKASFTTFSVMPSLLAGFLVIILYEKKTILGKVLFLALVALLTIFSQYFMYGIMGIGLIFISYLMFKMNDKTNQAKFIYLAGALAVLANLTTWFTSGAYEQSSTIPMALNFAINSFLATVVGAYLLLNNGKIDLKFKVPTVGKWAYGFYPLHLFFLYLITLFI